GHTREGDGGSEPTVDETVPPQDRPSAEEVFAERVGRLVELVERWRARIGNEAQRWPAVPLPGLEPDDPRRLAAEIAEELLRAGASPMACWGRGGPAPSSPRMAGATRAHRGVDRLRAGALVGRGVSLVARHAGPAVGFAPVRETGRPAVRSRGAEPLTGPASI